MANEIRVPIEVTKEREAERKLNQVGDAAERAGDSLEHMGEQATEAGKATEKAGDGFKDAADDAGHLDRQLQETTRHLRELIGEFDKTGDTSLLKDIRKERRSMRQFQSLAKELIPDVAPVAAKAGSGFGQVFISNVTQAMAQGGPYVTAAIVGLAVQAAPFVGATVAGAVLGGVGTGGIIGGIALAASDPRVSSVAEAVGGQLADEFQLAARSFVDPVIRSLVKIGDAGWADKLAPAFDRLSAHVDPLAAGLVGLVDNALPGLLSALDAAGPILDLLAVELPEVGAAIGDMLRIISEDPEGAKDALQTLLNLIEFTARATGYLISGLSQIYEKIIDVGEALGFWDMGEIKNEIQPGTRAINEFANAADDAEAAIKALDTATRAFLDKAFGLEAAQDRAADGFAVLTEQIKRQREEHVKGAGSLEGNTQAARDNREAMRSLIGDYQELIVETTKAGGKTDGLREDFIKNATAAGIARKEAERYANALFGIPTKINVSIAATIKAHGDMVAWSMFRAQERKQHEAENPGKRASGGPVSQGKTYWVGENGPELVTFGANGYVHNASASQAMVSGASGGSSMVSGGASVHIVLSAAPGAQQHWIESILPFIQAAVVGQGGIVQEVLGTPTR